MKGKHRDKGKVKEKMGDGIAMEVQRYEETMKQ